MYYRKNTKVTKKFLGNHWIVQYSGCTKKGDSDKLIINDSTKMLKIMEDVAKRVGAKILHSYTYQFSPQGVTAVVVISESHLSIHTWPEWNVAAFDFFTCNPKMDGETVVKYVAKKIGAEETESTLKRRYAKHIQE